MRWVLCGLEFELLDTLDGAQRVFAVAEGREAEIAFATGTETGTRRANDVDLLQQEVEEVPGFHVVRRLEPDIRGVDAAVDLETGLGQTLPNDAGILEVVADELLDLFLAFFRIDGCGTALDNVCRTIEFRRVAAVPELVVLDAAAIRGLARDRVRDDRVAAARARESGRLGERTEFDGDILGARDLIDRRRPVGLFGQQR